MVTADRKPSDILTREAFINAMRVNSAIGGSTNAPIHLIALARHMGVELTIDDWQAFGFDVPLLVNLMPAGEYLGEDYYRAGGVPAVIGELMRHNLIHEQALTANGRAHRRELPQCAQPRRTGHPQHGTPAQGRRRIPRPSREFVRLGHPQD